MASDLRSFGIIEHKNGTIFTINNSGAAMFGMEPSAMQGQSLYSFLDKSSKIRAQHALERKEITVFKVYGIENSGKKVPLMFYPDVESTTNEGLRILIFKRISLKEMS